MGQLLRTPWARVWLRRAAAVAWVTVGFALLWAYGARPLSESDLSARPGTSPAQTTTARTIPEQLEQAAVTRPLPMPAQAPAPHTGAPPVEIQISQLGVAAEVIEVGTTPEGSMAIPADLGTVGWYGYGPVPGSDAGSVVMAGHVNTRGQGVGVLARLAQVQPGMIVVVRTGDGSTHAYEVQQAEQFLKRELPVATIFNRDGAPTLTLITCGGRYLGRGIGYEENVVVTALPL